jgi:hypothetical protein
MAIFRSCYKVARLLALVRTPNSHRFGLKTLIPARTLSNMAHTLVRDPLPKHGYPGFGLPLRNNDWTNYNYYPIGAHANIWGSNSDILAVRELAMLDIMEKLTDKEDWHKKVFDEDIVSKWRKEALAVPDLYFWNLSISAKRQQWTTDDKQPELHDDWGSEECELEGVMDDSTFETVYGDVWF